MSKFKVGDRVQFIDDESIRNLINHYADFIRQDGGNPLTIVNQVFTISKILPFSKKEDHIYLKEFNKFNGLKGSRFKLAERQKTKLEPENV